MTKLNFLLEQPWNVWANMHPKEGWILIQVAKDNERNKKFYHKTRHFVSKLDTLSNLWKPFCLQNNTTQSYQTSKARKKARQFSRFRQKTYPYEN